MKIKTEVNIVTNDPKLIVHLETSAEIRGSEVLVDLVGTSDHKETACCTVAKFVKQVTPEGVICNATLIEEGDDGTGDQAEG